jgi:hypothetical protein
MADGTSAQRPTLWIVIAAVCALAAIGLGIWAVTTKSDLDEANDKVAALERQAAATAARQRAINRAAAARQQAIDRAAAVRYQRLRRSLIAARHEERNLNNRVRVEAAELQEARRAEANAISQVEREAATLRVARQEREVSAACARASIAAFKDLFDASNATAGAHAAINKLQQSQPLCEAALR